MSFINIALMKFICIRCNKELSAKQKLQNHINKKNRCELVEGNLDLSRKDMLKLVEKKYAIKSKQKSEAVKYGFNEVDDFNIRLKYNKPTKPLLILQCIAKIMKKKPEIAFLKPINNIARLSMYINGKWVEKSLQIVFTKLIDKYILDPKVNKYHYSNFKPEEHSNYDYIKKTYDRVDYYTIAKINENMKAIFNPRFKYIETEEEKKDRLEFEEREKDLESVINNYKKLDIQKQLIEERIKTQELNKKYEEEKNIETTKQIIKAIDKELNNRDFSSKINLAEIIYNEIVQNENNLSKTIKKYVDNLEEKDKQFVYDSYYIGYESDLDKDIEVFENG